MHCISVTYRTAPVDVREKFAWSNRAIDQLQNEDAVRNSRYGLVVLSTCNRSEIYFSSDIGMDTMKDLIKSHRGIDDALFDQYVVEYEDEDAARHLFEVTCGMDSMVIGEDEIQRQVKDAYQFAHELGKTGMEMNKLFQGALRCSRSIKAETDIKYLPVSIGTLTANYAAEFAKELGRPAKALIIGASGKIGSVVVKDMIDLKSFDIYCAMRQHHVDFGDDTLNGQVTEIGYDDRYSVMNDTDIVISVTRSPHCVIKKDRVESNIDDYKERLMIDLAIPRDIEPEVGEIEGVRLYDVDFIKNMAEENNRKKAEIRNEMNKKIDDIYHETLDDIGFSLLMDEKKDILNEEPDLKKTVFGMRATHSLSDLRRTIEIKEFAKRHGHAGEASGTGYFPFMIDLTGKKVLVVGAGTAAKYKVRSLVEAGADLTVKALAISPEVAEYSDSATIITEVYQDGEAGNYDIVVAATSNSSVNSRIVRDAKKAGRLVCPAEKPGDGDFIFPAVIRGKDYSVAVSTDGKDPHAAKLLKEKIADGLEDELADMVEVRDRR